MSTTVSYKGSTIATITDETKKLTTQGKICEDDITLTDVTPIPNLQTKSETYTPSTSQQTDTVTYDNGYTGLEQVNVTVNAMPSGTEGTPTATKGAVSGNAVTVTPSVTNSAGYISGGTHTGTGVSVSASELVSGTYTVSGSGTADVTNYASASVPAGSVTAPSTITGSSASVSAGTNTLTLSKTVSVTPSVTTAGYVTSGTAGNSNVSLTASVTTKGAATITPTTTNQTITSGTYLTGTQTISGDANLVAGNIKSGTTIFGVTGSYTGGGGTLTVATKTLTNTAVAQTLSFSSLSGQPKYWFLRVTSNVSSSGSTTYYYITDLFYNGTNITGNTFRIGSTRRVQNVTSGISQSYSSGTLTVTAGSSSGATPGQFYGASGIGYELVYIY